MTLHQSGIAAVIVACSALLPLEVSAEPPDLVVHEAAELLSEGLNGREEELALDKDALYALINGILLPRFDRRFSASQVLGKHWRTASDEQRIRFVEVFYTILLRRYADILLEFDLGSVQVLPFRGDATKKLARVRTNVRLHDGKKVPVNYMMVSRDDGWLMFDVSVEGISYVRNFRVELNSEIRATSLEQVIVRLEAETGGADE
ncbi:MAG: ABC transporter substrate-binding protein [Proteobacteria bacterium]|nr:ABC transporter substrate-binding protein [Pseudomonadota bacterium]